MMSCVLHLYTCSKAWNTSLPAMIAIAFASSLVLISSSPVRRLWRRSRSWSWTQSHKVLPAVKMAAAVPAVPQATTTSTTWPQQWIHSLPSLVSVITLVTRMLQSDCQIAMGHVWLRTWWDWQLWRSKLIICFFLVAKSTVWIIASAWWACELVLELLHWIKTKKKDGMRNAGLPRGLAKK